MIISIIASILALIYLHLCLSVIKKRGELKIPLGDDNNIEMKKWIRAQGNFIEYTPFIIILLFLIEYSKASKIEVLIVGFIFIISRISHIYALTQEEKYENNQLTAPPKTRKLAMQSTFAVLLYCAFRLIYITIF